MTGELIIKLASWMIFLMSVVLHECAHGWTALYFGDQTAKRAGRLTLNPFPHLDLVGSFLLPGILYFSGMLAIGWAKPVPVNFAYLRNPKRDMIWVALAGPGTNLVIAILLSILVRLSFVAPESMLWMVMVSGIFINIFLMFLNLIPIPPLDGSRVAMGLLPRAWAYQYSRLERYGMIIVILAFWFVFFRPLYLMSAAMTGFLLGA
jgi:Zn-dependent protease